MIKSIATGSFAFAAMFAMFTGTAKAEVPAEGVYSISNNFGDGVSAFGLSLKKVGTAGDDGIYEISRGGGQYLSAENSNEGAKAEYRVAKAARWILHQGGTGLFAIMHAENRANALTKSKDGKLYLRRNNAGGRGNADQAWKVTKR